jgi:hypothetical protein
MSAIFNKRNAFVGWLVVKNRKRVVKEAARSVPVPAAKTGIIAGAVAAVVGFAGGLLFWRKTRGSAE